MKYLSDITHKTFAWANFCGCSLKVEVAEKTVKNKVLKSWDQVEITNFHFDSTAGVAFTEIKQSANFY